MAILSVAALKAAIYNFSDLKKIIASKGVIARQSRGNLFFRIILLFHAGFSAGEIAKE